MIHLHTRAARMTLAGLALLPGLVAWGPTSPASAACTPKYAADKPYISVGTHVEAYFTICSFTGWRAHLAIERKGFLGHWFTIDEDKVSAQTGVNIRTKLSDYCDGAGTDKYRAKIIMVGPLNQFTSPKYSQEVTLTC